MILGVDVGLSGCLCLLDGLSKQIELFNMPIHELTVNGKKKNRIDVYELARWVDEHSKQIKHAYVEDVTSSPQMGVTSAFSFGQGAGIIHGIIAANFIPMTLVRPQVWKKHFGLKADKDEARRKASSLFPQYAGEWKRAKDDGRAESLLIAVYGSHAIR